MTERKNARNKDMTNELNKESTQERTT